MEKFLSIGHGFGPVWELHFDYGIVLAREYFIKHKLDFQECHDAYEQDENSELGKHWRAARQAANLALHAFNLYDHASFELELSDEDYY